MAQSKTMDLDPIIQDFITENITNAFNPNGFKAALWAQRTVLVFGEVERFLLDFDKRHEGKFEPYAPLWQEQQKVFRETIVASHKLPEEIMKSIKEFQECVLPLATSLKNEDKVQESTDEFHIKLKGLLERATALKWESKGFADKFFNNERAVTRFKKDFAKTVANEVESARILTPGVVYGLEYYVDVWNSVFTDLETVLRYMDYFDKKASTLPMMSRLYLKNVNAIYIKLFQALDQLHEGLTEALEFTALIEPPDLLDPLINMILASGAGVDDDEAATKLAEQLFAGMLGEAGLVEA